MDPYNQLPHLELSGELMLWPAVFSFSPWWWWINSRWWWTNDDEFLVICWSPFCSRCVDVSNVYICLLIFHSSTYPRLCRGCFGRIFLLSVIYSLYGIQSPLFRSKLIPKLKGHLQLLRLDSIYIAALPDTWITRHRHMPHALPMGGSFTERKIETWKTDRDSNRGLNRGPFAIC